VSLGKVPTAPTFRNRFFVLNGHFCYANNRLKVHSVLRKSFNDAVKRGLLAFNSCQRVDAPKHETKVGRAFSPEQMRTFLKEARTDRLHPFYVLAISTGCRQGELFELRWSDIDFEARELRITRTLVDVHGKLVVGPPKSKKGVRTIPLSAVALEALQAQRTRLTREGLSGCELVFPDCKGGWLRRQNVLRRSYRPILKRSGVDPEFRFHDLRHSNATLLLVASDVDVKTVSEQLGHSRVQVTLDLYVHGTDALSKRQLMRSTQC